jgi:hypothetical protein
MVTIILTLNNFSELPILIDLFGQFGNDYEYATRGIFRRKIPPICPNCKNPLAHNGYNHTPNETLEKSLLVDTNGQIIAVTFRDEFICSFK